MFNQNEETVSWNWMKTNTKWMIWIIIIIITMIKNLILIESTLNKNETTEKTVFNLR